MGTERHRYPKAERIRCRPRGRKGRTLKLLDRLENSRKWQVVSEDLRQVYLRRKATTHRGGNDRAYLIARSQPSLLSASASNRSRKPHASFKEATRVPRSSQVAVAVAVAVPGVNMDSLLLLHEHNRDEEPRHIECRSSNDASPSGASCHNM